MTDKFDGIPVEAFRRLAKAYREATESLFDPDLATKDPIHAPTEADKVWTQRARAILDEIATLPTREASIAALSTFTIMGAFLKGAAHGIGGQGGFSSAVWVRDYTSFCTHYQRGIAAGAAQPKEN